MSNPNPTAAQPQAAKSHAANPYAAPSATLQDAPEAYQPVNVFSVRGRIGRVRYILYSIGMGIAIQLVAGIFGGLLSATAGDNAALFAGFAALGGAMVISIMLTIQRCHDFNTTGWLSILGVIPLVNLIFWFIPGTDGPNRWGNKTAPNGTAAIVLVCIVPAIFILGILAAIAIPAYQSYLQKAKARGALYLPATPPTVIRVPYASAPDTPADSFRSPA